MDKILDSTSIEILKFFYENKKRNFSVKNLKEKNVIIEHNDLKLLNQYDLVWYSGYVNSEEKLEYIISPEGIAYWEKYIAEQQEIKENQEFRKLQSEEIRKAINYYNEDIRLGKKANRKSTISLIIAILAMLGTIGGSVIALIALLNSL